MLHTLLIIFRINAKIAPSAPVLLLSVVTVSVNVTTASAVCVLLCIRKCWKYRHPYVQPIQIITLGHQRSKRQKGHLNDMSHCLFSTLQSGNYLSPVHWSTQNVTFVALFI